jgi:hypothetical protein
MWRRVVWCKLPSVSEDCTAPIFRVKELDKQAVLPCLFAYWANSLILKVGEVLSKRRQPSADYTASHTKRWYCSSIYMYLVRLSGQNILRVVNINHFLNFFHLWNIFKVCIKYGKQNNNLNSFIIHWYTCCHITRTLYSARLAGRECERHKVSSLYISFQCLYDYWCKLHHKLLSNSFRTLYWFLCNIKYTPTCCNVNAHLINKWRC